jgi:hypothetical protein
MSTQTYVDMYKNDLSSRRYSDAFKLKILDEFSKGKYSKMLKNKLILLCFLISLKLNAQTFLEVIPNFGFWNSEIVNTKSHNSKATIGKGLWKPSYGYSAVVNFGFPDEALIYGVGFNFNISTKGSVSELYPSCKIEMPARSFGLFCQVNYKLDPTFLFDFQMGFAIDKFLAPSYQGNRSQLESFPRLNNELSFKDSEALLIYSIGIKTQLFDEKLTISLDLTGDAGINKLNSNQGSFATQSLGFKLGLGIIIKDLQDSQWIYQ